MGYERYPRNTNPQGDYYGRTDPQDYGRDYGSGRDGSYSSARDYEASGEIGNDRDRDWRSRDQGRDSNWRDQGSQGSRGGYGPREYGNAGYGQQRSQSGRGYGQQYGQQSGQQYGQSRGSRDYGYGSGSAGSGSYGRDQNRDGDFHGSYGSDGRRFEDVGNRRDWDNDDRHDPDRSRYGARGGQYGGQQYGQSYGQQGRQPQGYNQEDRGFFQRAGDEVRSWFGDDEAERRREQDARYDERQYAGRSGETRHDEDYHSWRRTQIDALDRDYDEYRSENRQKFHNEFGAWRGKRQGQRDLLGKVDEHMDVVGSDGEHVGTVDKVRGDRVILTKSDADAGGRHHSFPSGWLDKVDGKVTLNKSAADAKAHWKDEERNQAMFGNETRSDLGQRKASDDQGGGMLNKSFAGTYDGNNTTDTTKR